MTQTNYTSNAFGSILSEGVWSRSSKNYRCLSNEYCKLTNDLREYRPDYYPFGSSLPTRSWSDASRQYRYGFNGKEKDSETANDAYDFGARIYDGRLGRWMSLDPLMKRYAGFTPYHYCGDNPILFVDFNGEEMRFYNPTAGDGVPWKQFKEVVESRFNNLVSVGYVEVKYEQNVINADGTTRIETIHYYKLVLTVNEAELRTHAIKQLPAGADEASINKQIEIERQKLSKNKVYSRLNIMASSAIVANFDLNLEKNIGSFVGKHVSETGQQIGMRNMYSMKKIGPKAPFNALYHELVEGYTYYFNKKNGLSTSYGDCHIGGLEAQAEDLGVLFVINESHPNTKGGSTFVQGGEIKILVYTLGENENEVKEITYTINVKDGAFGDATKSSMTITKEDYNNKKNEAKKAAKAVNDH